jgi:hypothetical protein
MGCGKGAEDQEKEGAGDGMAMLWDPGFGNYGCLPG